MALVEIPSVVVTPLFPVVAKRKGRRSWDGGPSGLLLLQTPGPAERKVGRSLKFRSMPVAYHFTVKLRTDINGVLRSSFFAGSAFLLFFTGFAVGFIVLSPSRSNFGGPLPLPPHHLQSLFQTEARVPWSNKGT